MKRRRFIVIGLGEFGSAVARELTECDCEVVAVDIAPDRVDAIPQTGVVSNPAVRVLALMNMAAGSFPPMRGW